ncbi:MAG: DNA-binding protein WhiA [Clostridia bacterium]|nr:DNA-binding protein WhiA [Clostridia bacterium]
MKKSFTYEVKKELLTQDREAPGAFLAFAYGLFLFASAFSLNGMYIKTENKLLAEMYAQCAKRLAGVKPVMHATQGGTYTCAVESKEERLKILAAFSLSGSELTLRINRTNIDTESCYPDFLAGAFCACGTVANPQKDYHLEFSVSYYQLCKDLMKLISEIEPEEPLNPKKVVRKYEMVIYFKGSESIEDLLFFMGAQNHAFDVVNVKVEKDIRNRANRLKNCDSANLDKVIKSGVKQAKAIRRIKNKRGFESLPEELREIAELRMNNPDMSLSEIAQNLSEPISRSGVNHRLKKLEHIAEEL